MSPLILLSTLSLLLLLMLTDGDGVKIVKLEVPSGVPNTTTSAVILDCDFSLETASDSGLVVQWFYNEQSNLVYQWIPGRKPQDAGLLKNRIDLNHTASDDPKKMYRAMKIMSPTTDLSGVYTCVVSTFDDEARQSKKMTIYTPAKNFEFSQKEDQEKGEISLHCSAEGIYPEPEFNITTREKTNFFHVTSEKMSSKDELYDVEATITFLRKDLPSKTTFDCVLSIPETDYQETKTISIPTARGKSFLENLRTTQSAPIENIVTAPDHYDPDIFFIRGESSSSTCLGGTIFSILVFNVLVMWL